MDPMSGCDIRLVFTLPPRDSTLQYKRCVHLWNYFPCIIKYNKSILWNKLQEYKRIHEFETNFGNIKAYSQWTIPYHALAGAFGPRGCPTRGVGFEIVFTPHEKIYIKS